MVTLDDLLLDEAAPLDQLASVVQAQLGAGGPAPPTREVSRERGSARAEATYARFLDAVGSNTGFDAGLAETAAETVLSALVQRLTPGEADDLIAQLPSLLHARLKACRRAPTNRSRERQSKPS